MVAEDGCELSPCKNNANYDHYGHTVPRLNMTYDNFFPK